MENKANNCVKGVVYSNDLRGIEEATILDELSSSKVIEVKKIMKKLDGILTETGLIILTFDSTHLPEKISIGYEKVNVRQYIPLPMRCSKCLMFGHPTKYCKDKEYCLNCGKEDHISKDLDEKCQQMTNCKVCAHNNLPSTNHFILNSSCPIFMKEKEIQAIRITENIDMKTARKRYNDRHNSLPTINSTTSLHHLRHKFRMLT